MERFKWDQPKEDEAKYVERVKRLRATAYKHELYAVALHLAYVGWDRERFLTAAGDAWDAAMKRDQQVAAELECEALQRQCSDALAATPETVRKNYDLVTKVCEQLNSGAKPISAGKWDK